MNVDLLSIMVKELILVNDKVWLPELGAFVAEVVPSVFSDRGYTVNPPYRKLSFRTKAEPDDLLTTLYAKSNNIDQETANRVLSDFLRELKDVLLEKKLIVFPGLGRLRATKENNLFFIPDEDLDIYPAGFGLEAISLKTHHETHEQVSQVVGDLRAMIDEVPDVVSVTKLNDPAVAEMDGESVDAAVAEIDDVVEAESEVEPESELDVESEIESEVEPESESESEVESEPESESEVESEVEPESEVESEVESEIESEVEPESEVEAESELEMTSESDMTPESDIETEIESEVVTEPDSEVVEEEQNIIQEEPEKAVIEEEKKNIKKNKSPWKKLLIGLLIIIVLAAVALGIFLLLVEFCPEFVDKLLYTEEELQIINGVL